MSACPHNVRIGNYCTRCKKVVRLTRNELDWNHYINANVARVCVCDICNRLREANNLAHTQPD